MRRSNRKSMRRSGRVNRRSGRVNRRSGRVNRRSGRVNRRSGRVNRRSGRKAKMLSSNAHFHKFRLPGYVSRGGGEGDHFLGPFPLSFRTLNSVWVKCPMNKHLNGEYINIAEDHYVKDSKYHLNKNSENYWQIFVTIPIMSASQLNSEPDLEQVAKDGEEGQHVLAVYTDYAAEEGEHPPTGKQRWTSSPTAVYLPDYAGPAHQPATFWLHEDDKDWMRVYSEGKFMWVEKKLSGGWWSRRRGRGSRQKKEIGEPDDFSWTVEIEIIITVKGKSTDELSRLLENRPSVLSPITVKK